VPRPVDGGITAVTVSVRPISLRTARPSGSGQAHASIKRARRIAALLLPCLGASVLVGIMLVLSARGTAALQLPDGYSFQAVAPSTGRVQFDDAWTRRAKLTFSNTEQTEDLLGFPVLVVLDSTRIDYTACQSSGQDIRFVDSDDVTVLSHEIEHWDASGTSYVWVKVPQIDGRSNADFIWMYYGNPDASDGQAPADVWTSGYRMVYHLNEDAAPSGGTIHDSTSRFDAINRGTSSAAGYIAGAQAFDGANQWIDLGTDLAVINHVTATTLSAWVMPHSTRQDGDIIAVSRYNNGNPTGNSRASLVQTGANLQVYARSTNDESDWNHIPTTSAPLSEVDWYHVVAVIDYQHDDVTIYVDGVQQPVQGPVAFVNEATPDTNSENGALGSNDDGLSSYFNGLIDEVRVAAGARSGDWVAAQYLGTRDAFIGFGREEDVGLPILGLDAWASQEKVFAGAPLDYSLLVSNTGGRALNLVVSDTLPTHTTFVGCNCSHAGWTVPAALSSNGPGCGSSFSCFLDGDQVVWKVDQLESRQLLQMTLDVVTDSELEAGTAIVNDGYAMVAERLAPVAVSKPVTVTVRDLALSIAATAYPNPVRLGQRLQYSFTVSNDSGPLHSLTVTDRLPNDVSYVSCGGALCELDVDGAEVRWWLPNLVDGSEVQLSMDVVVRSVENDAIINEHYGVWVPEAARAVMGAPISVEVQGSEAWSHFLNLPSMFGGMLP
jgi:uncharacterized repeat protein (TIGR01451 family)